MRVLLAAVGLAVLGAIGFLAWPSSKDVPKETPYFALPSGMEAYLQEVLNENAGDGLVYRFRFVAPAFTGQEDFETQSADLEFLCTTRALPQLANLSPAPSKIVVSLADQPSPFGVLDPDVAQIFESFSLQDGACMWEMF